MARKLSKTSRAVRKTSSKSASAEPVNSSRLNLTAEYKEYLERYAAFGEGRPKLSPQEFDELDDEMLELLAIEAARLTDDQVVRIQELEYLLIDTE